VRTDPQKTYALLVGEEGKARQTPTHFWYKNWDGSERVSGNIPDYSKVDGDYREITHI
jgi:hypothetical protein